MMVMQSNANHSSEIILVILTNYHIDSKHYLSTLSPFVFFMSIAFSIVWILLVHSYMLFSWLNIKELEYSIGVVGSV